MDTPEMEDIGIEQLLRHLLEEVDERRDGVHWLEVLELLKVTQALHKRLVAAEKRIRELVG